MLAKVYSNAFARAREQSVTSIAFPAISAGAYKFPAERAASIALSALLGEEPHFERIVACLFDDAALGVYQRVLTKLRAG